jgi:hypothetical protein
LQAIFHRKGAKAQELAKEKKLVTNQQSAISVQVLVKGSLVFQAISLCLSVFAVKRGETDQYRNDKHQGKIEQRNKQTHFKIFKLTYSSLQ